MPSRRTIVSPPESELAALFCPSINNRGALRPTRAIGVESNAFRETSLEAEEVVEREDVDVRRVDVRRVKACLDDIFGDE